MLTVLRAIVLALFIAAPFGEPPPAADLESLADGYARAPVLSCPHGSGLAIDDEDRIAG